MNLIKQILNWSFLILILTSCGDIQNTDIEEEQTETSTEENTVDIEKIKARLCNEFPKEIVLKYNPDAIKLEVEPIDNGSGGILNCNLKLFYGEKEYEHWKGQISASINKAQDPFIQYNPKRNATLFHEVKGLGEKAVYISNMYQLLILKNGVLYAISPPANGNTTNSGKEIKEIAIEIAQNFKL